MKLRHIFWMVLLCWAGVLGAQTYRVGDLYTAPDSSQGIVFYVFPDGTGGWVVALNDASAGCRWGSSNDNIADLEDRMPTYYQEMMADTSGYTNTAIIRNHQSYVYYAAWQVDFDNGWYLPAPGQLRILFARKPILDTLLVAAGGSKFANTTYWTSSERDSMMAWGVDFSSYYTRGQIYPIEKYYYYSVRAVRTFTYESSCLWSTGDTTPAITVSPSQTTDYNLMVSNPVGCSDQASFSLTVNYPYDEVVRDTACGPYERDGMTYTSSGIYVNRFSTVAGCDSVITLYLSVSPAPEVSITQQPYSVCEGETFTMQTAVTNVGGRFRWQWVTFYVPMAAS